MNVVFARSRTVYVLCACVLYVQCARFPSDNLTDVPPVKRVCYYAPNDTGAARPSDLNPRLCTHVIYGFAVVRNGTLTPAVPADVAKYLELTSVKHFNPELRVLLSVGGGGGGREGFSEMAQSPETRQIFLTSAVEMLQSYHFDGLDIDWEFPAKRDRHNFVQLLKEARLLFGKASFKRQQQFLLSVAVAATKAIVDVSYDITGMAKYVDFVNLMSYDYHVYAPYLPFTGHNSPLFHRKTEEEYFSTLNTAWSAEYWVSRGMPRGKIMVGIPIYARTFQLLSADRHGFDAPVVGVGANGGSVDFPWVCQFLRNGSTSVFDDESQVPYAFKNLSWVAYDTFRSIRSKVVWVKAREFAGVMTFDLCSDDAVGSCGQGKFPLHNMIYNMLT